ncbi:BCCT family transporter [uncultured Anaerococcus sp.]|uniref:BCCT family transporter n=1 Tax=uncultured Anaerococcus sp. TaxID=293428 RepID=UPI0025D1760F|nr:BCCT family transporter [uncultured Anaerococcus sp.]
MGKENSFIKKSKVYIGSLSILLLLVIAGIIIPAPFQAFTSDLTQKITRKFGWFYLLLVTGILLFLSYLIVSPIGQIRLGNPKSKPEHSIKSWIAMMFSAGMGIGLVLYGAAEPLSHYAINTPASDPGTADALADSFKYTFFHWGIHAWGVYSIVGLALAFSVIMIIMAASLLKELNHEKDKMGLSIILDRLPKKDKPFKSYKKDIR